MTDPKTPRPAEEVAREMAQHLGNDGRVFRVLLTSGTWQTVIETREPDTLARVLAERMGQARAEGAAAERERCAGIVRGMLDARDSSITYVRAAIETVLEAIVRESGER